MAELKRPAPCGVEAGRKRRGLILELLYVNEVHNDRAISLAVLWGALNAIGDECGYSDVIDELRHLRSRGYVKASEHARRSSALINIRLADAGRRIVKEVIADAR